MEGGEDGGRGRYKMEANFLPFISFFQQQCRDVISVMSAVSAFFNTGKKRWFDIKEVKRFSLSFFFFFFKS